MLPDLLTAATEGESGPLALDLFAGVGFFTLPLAGDFEQVVAVEVHPRAVADLQANAESYGFENVPAVQQTALDYLRRFAQAEPHLVVLGPPRAGVGPGPLKLLLATRPRRILYVSCNPPTLARDLAYVLARGHRLKCIELLDFFPQTFRLGCLVKLSQEDVTS